MVLGLFTWNDSPAYNHREIDIEFSRWGQVNNQNAQYVVQPYSTTGNIVRWQQPALSQSTHEFNWQSASIAFQSIVGLLGTPSQGPVVQQWTYPGTDNPVPGGENARVNLWLYNGSAPTNGQPVEVIINRFEFVQAT